jgi:hypothetical protein
MTSATTSPTTKERLLQLREAEPTISQAEAARRLGVTRARMSALAHELGIAFPRKVASRGACGKCRCVRLLQDTKKGRRCAGCAS